MTRPVHQTIRDDLRLRIGGGEWGPGERLPSELDLATNYGVARMTVRQAIGALAAEGVIIRRQGLGTFVSEELLPRSIGEGALSYSEDMRSRGREIQTRVIRTGVEEPPHEARDALNLTVGTSAVTIHRLRLMDSLPVVLQRSWLPYALFAGLDNDPLDGGSLYAVLESRYGISISRTRQVFTAATASKSDATWLEVKTGAPVLRVDRITFDGSNRPIEYGMSAMRSGVPIESVTERARFRRAVD